MKRSSHPRRRSAAPFALWLLLAAGWAAGPGGDARAQAAGPSASLVVYAAASAQNALKEIAKRFERETGVGVQFDFGSSGALARRIASGAPVDVFVSASPEWVDYLEEKRALEAGSRGAIARNALVCAVGAAAGSSIARPEDLLRARRISIGDPAHVPVGRYARQALRKLRLWKRLGRDRKLVFAQDARAALAFVERGEAPAGIVYRTDARQSRRVRIAFAFPEETHGPILYVAAAVAGRASTAKAFLKFLGSAGAREIMRKNGFSPPPRGAERRP